MKTIEMWWWWWETIEMWCVVRGRKINGVVVLHSFTTVHEAVLKKNVESRVDVGSMWSWMEKYI